MSAVTPGMAAALVRAAADDEIAQQVGELIVHGERTGQPAASRERRVAVAVSIAIERAADPLEDSSGYGVAMRTWRALHREGLEQGPERTARFVATYGPEEAPRLAVLADGVADHLAASAADLLDGGETVAAWRRYAVLLREIERPAPGRLRLVADTDTDTDDVGDTDMRSS